MSDIEWVDIPRSLTCRVCGVAAMGTVVAVATMEGRPTIEAVKCAGCGSLDLLDESAPSSSNDSEVDHYVEVGAGIATIIEALDLVDPKRVKRFLDVGCGYGFSLDVGRALHGWDVRGVEPSRSAVRGAAELGVDIRDEFLDSSSDIGSEFDLIFSSEVIEHVPDPRVFLAEIRQRLARRGCVVLTTPAAEAISTEFPVADALSALSPGFHTVLMSVKGMELLLRNAGFRHVEVVRKHANIRVVASVRGRRWRVADRSDRLAGLDDYYLATARRAQEGSALGVGMAVRYLRSIVAQGKFAKADVAEQLVTVAIQQRYGLALDDPAAVSDHVSTRDPIAVLAGAAFSLGMLELIHRRNSERAASYFELARSIAFRTLEVLDPTDLDSIDIIVQSAYHRALALARINGQSAASAAMGLCELDALPSSTSDLWVQTGQVRVFVEMVAHMTETDASDEFTTLVGERALGLVQSDVDSARVAGLDGLYSLGAAAARAGNTIRSLRWLTECISECAKRPSTDEHALQLTSLCHALIPENAVRLGGDVPLHHMIDVYWCDASGTFLQGWAHSENVPISSITISVGESTAVATLHDRDDLLSFWPHCPEAVHGGFSVYIPGAPDAVPTLHLMTKTGIVARQLVLPPHQVPASADGYPGAADQAMLDELMANAPDGPVLAIGVRSATEEDARAQVALFEGREVVGFDIHPGFGVDVVGDVHDLSSYFPANHFAVVYSASVLEHVAMPWLVAAQCARVTMVGGLNVHQTPWMWPTHSQPNDFWRVSAGGLEHLFSASLGFELQNVVELGAATVIPQGAWRYQHLSMPSLYSAAGARIVAKKVDDAAASVSWPYEAKRGSSLAQQYPVDGLAKGGEKL